MDDYFARARLAAYDDRAGTALQASPEEYHALGHSPQVEAPDVFLRALRTALAS